MSRSGRFARVLVLLAGVAWGLAPLAARAAAPSGLAGLWNADGNANDLLGRNNGTMVGSVSYVTGQFGQAFGLNGSSSSIRVPATASLPHGNSPRTISAWIYTRPSSWADNVNTVFHAGAIGLPNGSFSLDMRPYPNMEFYTWGAGDLVFNAGVPVEGWVNIAITYDGTTESIYTQGQLRATRSVPGGLNTAVADLDIGRIPPPFAGSGAYFDGLIDEFAIFDRALTTDEVRAVYTGGALTVNHPPVANTDDATTNEDVAIVIPVTGNDTDADHDALAVTGVSTPALGAAVINADGTITYTPNPDANGSDSFTYTIEDGQGAAATGTVAVTINPVNDPPTFALGPEQVVDEDAGPQAVVGWATGISAGPADESGQTVTFVVSTPDQALFAVPPAISPDGTLTYTPAPDANGQTKVSVRLVDDGASASVPLVKKGRPTAAGQVFAITINPVNDPPVLGAVGPQAVLEGQALTFQVTATDIDGPVSLSLSDSPAGATLEDHQDGTGTFSWTPGYDQAGTWTMDLTASDGSLSTTQRLAITVTNATATLTATAGANGSISPAGASTVEYGGTQTYAITAATGFHVADVLVDGASVGAVAGYTFSGVTTGHTIAASFAIDTFNLTATAGANGAIAPAGAAVVNFGGGQTYLITAGIGYHVADVQVDGFSVGALSSWTFAGVAANHTIAAAFAINTYTLTAAAGPGGTVSPAGVTTVPYGGSQSFAVVAALGYRVADILVDGASIIAHRDDHDATDDALTVGDREHGSVAQAAKGDHADGSDSPPTVLTSYLFTNVTANHALSVRFAALTLAERIQSLIRTVQTMASTGGLATGTGASLAAKLHAALEAASSGKTRTAVNELNAFLQLVKAQGGKKLTAAQAGQLTAAAQAIIGSTGAAKPVAEDAFPTSFELGHNYPNPFNPSTAIPYSVTEGTSVRLAVYSLLGQQVRVLVDQYQGPGSYAVAWDGLDAAEVPAASGVYLIRLEAGDQVQIRKMTLAR